MKCGEGVCDSLQDVFKAFCHLKAHKNPKDIKKLWDAINAFQASGIKCDQGNKIMKVLEPKFLAIMKLGAAVPGFALGVFIAGLGIHLEELKKCCKD